MLSDYELFNFLLSGYKICFQDSEFINRSFQGLSEYNETPAYHEKTQRAYGQCAANAVYVGPASSDKGLSQKEFISVNS